jgi:hypothetical protein
VGWGNLGFFLHAEAVGEQGEAVFLNKATSDYLVVSAKHQMLRKN